MKKLPSKKEKFSDWYTDVILQSELADYAPVRGCMVIRPYGYTLWENIQRAMDVEIKEKGIFNAYFPLFIPESFLKKEKEHVEGFAPQAAVVTIGGGQKLKEVLYVRPTSETIMYEMYKRWAHSWRDLPLIMNQWNNIVRWEKRTYLFLRTSEFLWQEGHGAHATSEENMDVVGWALSMYQKIYKEQLALWGIPGLKSQGEKFAGAVNSYSYEIMIPDGKALQGCTSHDLGQNFSKAIDWGVAGQTTNEKIYPYQNSWGFSTRSIGGLVMVHGDEKGLLVPPKIAPIQVVIIPIPSEGKQDNVIGFTDRIRLLLKESGIRVEIDDRADETPGFKFNKWELRGVPIRLEIGAKEMETEDVTVVRRTTGEKTQVSVTGLIHQIQQILDGIQNALLEKHREMTINMTTEVSTYEEFKKAMEEKKGFLKVYWCEDESCAAKIKDQTKATPRCLPLDMETFEPCKEDKGKCVACGKEANHRWLFGQAY
jgi:prolyl-tRNA synthetase